MTICCVSAVKMMESNTCPLCEKRGLKSYQINLEEAVTLCANKKCIYPFSDGLSGCTFSRQISDVQSSRWSDLAVPAAQQELQSRTAAHMKQLGLQLQNHGKGIQTGSPQIDKLKTSCRKPLLSRDTTRSVSNDGMTSLPCQSRQEATQRSVPLAVQVATENCSAAIGNYKRQEKKKYWRKRNGSTESLDADLMNSNSDYMDSSSDKSSTDGKVLSMQRSFPFTCSLDNAYSPNLLEKLCTESVSEQTKPVNVLINLDIHLNANVEKSLLKQLIKSTEKSSCYPTTFAQWKNKDNLCWLDVVLCLCVHNMTLKRQVLGSSFDTDCLMYRLLKAHDQAQSLLANSKLDIIQDSPNNSDSTTDTTTQAKNTIELKELNEAEISLLCGSQVGSAINKEAATLNYSSVAEILNGVREEVWQFLQTKLRCRRGQHESPVFALPLFLRQSPTLSDVFKMKYSFEYKCTCCDYTESHSFENLLPTFPELVDDFAIACPSHKKKCPECGNTDDVRTMVYKHIPDTLLMHFTSGLPSMPLSDLQLCHHGNTYTVTGLVQYQVATDKPNHFVAWLGNPDKNTWMRCDDLDDPVCSFDHAQPAVASSEVHIVMWEKILPKTQTCRHLAMVTDNILSDQPGCHDNDESFLDNGDNLPTTDGCGVSEENSDDINRIQRKAAKTMSYEPFKFGANRGEHNSQSSEKCSRSGDFKSVSTATVSHVKQCLDLNNKQDNMDSDSGLSSMCNEPVKIAKKKKTDCRNLSPCSVGSSESSESIHLPNFVAMTPVTGAVQRPIACRSTMSSNPNMETSGNVQLIGVNLATSDSKMNNHNREKQGVLGTADSSSQMYSFDLPTMMDVSCSKLNGNVSSIQPSTVFCKPVKTLPVTLPCSQVKCTAVPTFDTKLCESTLHKRNETDELLSATQKKATELKSKTVSLVPCYENNRDSANSTPKSGRMSSQSSRFKLPPFTALSKKRTTIDRNAFFTLEKQIVETPESTSVTLTEASSTLSQVKQYLLNRTTGIAKTKFEGLNLKSNVGSSACYPVFSQSNEQFTRSQNDFQMRTTMSVNNIHTKRKSFSNISDFHHLSHKKSKVELGTNSESNSLQENFSSKKTLSQLRKHTVKPNIAGKNMKMVDQWAADSINVTNLSETPDFLKKSCVSIATEKDHTNGTATVLQDLYDALNIPYNTVQDTMTSIMSDVDDILNFVDANEALRDDMRVGSPESCRSIPVFREHFKHYCMVRIPGRNSA